MISSLSTFERGSFRDRSGRVFHHQGNVFRALAARGMQDWLAIADKEFMLSAMQSGRVVRTKLATGIDPPNAGFDCVGVLQHETIPVVTWAFEWSFSMLREAALLTLDLLENALQDGAILKDATPYNVQFVGSCPIFIDTSSFEPLQPGQIWEGYRQFCQTFLYPLMLQCWKNVDFQPMLRGSLEGITPTDFARLISIRDLFRRGAMSHVWLHSRLQSSRVAKPHIADSMKASGFNQDMILNNVRGLQKIVQGLTWNLSESTWSDYDESSEPVQRDAVAKEEFITQVCSRSSWKTVWDLGCNQGRYSRIAALHAKSVLAIDSDHLTVDRLFQSLHAEQNLVITPLVSNLADPAPALGWRLRERQSLEERSKPDLVFCLALIHHLVIGSNLLLSDVIDWLASLRATVVLEYVDREDTQVKQLLANRADVFSDYNQDAFESLVSRSFEVVRKQTLTSGTRTLFLLRPK